MTSDDPRRAMPSLEEIQAQVVRIKSSKYFKNAEQRKKLLDYLVERSLAGKGSTEGDIAADLFSVNASKQPENRPESVVPSQVRGKLRDFYERHPSDRVHVRIPPVKESSGYYVEFSYTRNPDATKAYELGLQLLENTTLGATIAAANYFQKAAEVEPDFDLAFAFLAEAEFRCALLYAINTERALSQSYIDPREIIAWLVEPPQQSDMLLRRKRARDAAETAISLNARLWNAHLVLGAVYASYFDWLGAEEAFRAAINLAPDEACTHPIYAAYLMAIGNTSEAVSVLSKRLDDEPDEQMNHVLLGLFKAVGGFPSEPHLQDTQAHWLAPLSIDLDRLRRQGVVPEKPFPLIRDANRLLNISWYPLGLRLMGKMRFRKHPLFSYDRSFMNKQTFGMCLDYLKEAVDWAIPNPSPFQMAIAYLALSIVESNVGVPAIWCDISPNAAVQYGTPEIWTFSGYEMRGRAVDCLEMAFDQHDPMLVWFHLWPIFGPLEKVSGFEALAARMKLPGTAGFGC
jgi:tetratricopeptide (TPR) repeat protein